MTCNTVMSRLPLLRELREVVADPVGEAESALFEQRPIAPRQ